MPVPGLSSPVPGLCSPVPGLSSPVPGLSSHASMPLSVMLYPNSPGAHFYSPVEFMTITAPIDTSFHHRLCHRCVQATYCSWKPMSFIHTHSTCRPSGSFLAAALQQRHHLMAALWLLFTRPRTKTCHACSSHLNLSPHRQSSRASSRSLLLRGQLSMRR